MAQGLAQQQSTCLVYERSSAWSQHRAEKEERDDKERIDANSAEEEKPLGPGGKQADSQLCLTHVTIPLESIREVTEA